MESTHALRAHVSLQYHPAMLKTVPNVSPLCTQQEVRGSPRVNGFSEASPSPDSRESDPSSTPMDAPLASPSRSDSATPTRPTHLHTSTRSAYGDQKVTVSLSIWQSPCHPTAPSPSPPPLHSIYGLWSCMYDVEDFQVVSPLTPCLDGDIFGVGKRPIQREVEMDGCVRLVFVEE